MAKANKTKKIKMKFQSTCAHR